MIDTDFMHMPIQLSA